MNEQDILESFEEILHFIDEIFQEVLNAGDKHNDEKSSADT